MVSRFHPAALASVLAAGLLSACAAPSSNGVITRSSQVDYTLAHLDRECRFNAISQEVAHAFSARRDADQTFALLHQACPDIKLAVTSDTGAGFEIKRPEGDVIDVASLEQPATGDRSENGAAEQSGSAASSAGNDNSGSSSDGGNSGSASGSGDSGSSSGGETGSSSDGGSESSASGDGSGSASGGGDASASAGDSAGSGESASGGNGRGGNGRGSSANNGGGNGSEGSSPGRGRGANIDE